MIQFLVYFWYVLTGTNLSMFFMSAILERQDMMALNAVSMFACLLMAQITKKRLEQKNADLSKDNE
jgi:PIN domain nuclease of toxin-antitoxin system